MSAILATALTAAATGTATVSALVNDVTTTVYKDRDMVIAVGEIIVVQRIGSQWVAISRIFGSAPGAPALGDENPTAPPPKPAVTTGTLVVSPVGTGSYRNSAWRTDNTEVYQGEYGGQGNHKGAVFYGTKPQSLAGATVVRATIRVQRDRGGTYAAQPTTMWLMTQKTKPAGAPTFTSSTSGPSLAVGATNNAFVVPTSWAQSMVDGTAGGLGFFDSTGSPYVKFYGRTEWSAAFTMSIEWKRG